MYYTVRPALSYLLHCMFASTCVFLVLGPSRLVREYSPTEGKVLVQVINRSFSILTKLQLSVREEGLKVMT